MAASTMARGTTVQIRLLEVKVRPSCCVRRPLPSKPDFKILILLKKSRDECKLGNKTHTKHADCTVIKFYLCQIPQAVFSPVLSHSPLRSA